MEAKNQQFCNPQEMAGFCQEKAGLSSTSVAKCHMNSGAYCENGRVLPDSLTNDLAVEGERVSKRGFDDFAGVPLLGVLEQVAVAVAGTAGGMADSFTFI